MRTLIKTALLALFAGVTLHVNAQEDDMPGLPEDRIQEIKAQKSAFITQRLDLSPEEAQKFWPVYNQYDKEIEANRKEMRANHKALKGDAELSESEASAAIEKDLASRQKELDIRKKYAAEFKKTFGAVKTMKLAQAEREFQKELIKRVREHKENRGDGHQRPGRP